jgi:hypothetical protein
VKGGTGGVLAACFLCDCIIVENEGESGYIIRTQFCFLGALLSEWVPDSDSVLLFGGSAVRMGT